MTNENWVPNHFLAVLPIEIEYLGNITLQREKLIEMKKLEEEAKYQETPTELPRETRREERVPKEKDMEKKQELPKRKIRKRKWKDQKRKTKREKRRRKYQKRKTWKRNKMYQRRKKIKSTSLDKANTPHAEVPPPAERLGRNVLVKYEEIKALSSYRG